jgi:glycine betaine/choline ABC-type transport system substrate-binding protein
VVIGSKAFTESIIVGEIAAQHLERAGVPVERRFNLGATNICFEAVRSGAIDLYPEYTGTALMAILHHASVADAAQALTAVREELERDHALTWLAPLGFDNTYALAVPEALAARLGIEKISDLRAHPGLRVGFASEFLAREDGWPGLRARYDLRFDTPPGSMEAGLMYQAAASGELDVVSVYSTDGRIETQHLRVLDDDLRFFPPYEAGFIARRASLAKSPRLAELLGGLAGRIGDAEMRRMNADVDLGKRSVEDVARTFLEASETGAPHSTAGAAR